MTRDRGIQLAVSKRSDMHQSTHNYHGVSMRMKKIMIIDDHPLVRIGFRLMIETEPGLSLCCEAASIDEALALIRHSSPDLAVVDLSLPDGSGLDLIKRMLAKRPELLVLVYSMHDEDLFAERVLLAGAKGYINKQEGGEQVITAIKQILDGKIYLSPEMTKYLKLKSSGDLTEPALTPVEHLSNREMEVFELIGHGATTSEIASRLNLSVKTIESHRANIKSKLGLRSSGELVRHAVQWTLTA
jgi:DNA-binding NarL/FixJ family response regulator